jgi:hypothetical protein
MDKTTLVEGQIRDGQRLIDHLAANGIPVTAACWMKESDGGLWYLYLATPLVNDDAGTTPAYHRINAVIRSLPEPLGFSPFQIKAVSSAGPVAQAILEYQRRYPVRYPLAYGGPSLGGVSIDAGHIYPPTGVPAAP